MSPVRRGPAHRHQARSTATEAVLLPESQSPSPHTPLTTSRPDQAPPLCPGGGRAANCPAHTGPALTMAGSGQPAAPASATQARGSAQCREERLFFVSQEAGLATFPEENTIFIK